jgi:hypothetical protein
MIHRLHLLVLAAAAAALLGAPSAAFAASTSLGSATVSPGSGTTDTTFVFTVSFDGAGKFSATSVTVSVAGRTLPMSRVSGTALLGVYRAASTLPAGTWSVTFNATVAQGPSASLAGPTVRVIVPATPMPTLAPTPVPTLKTTPAPTQSAISGSGSSPTPSSVAMPAATPIPTSSSAPIATAAPAAGGGSTGGGGGTGPAPAPASGGNENTSGSTGGGKGTTAATPGAAASGKERAASASGSPMDGAPAGTEIDPRSGTATLLLYALGGLTAAIAVIGFLFLIPWRRRRDAEPAAESALAGAGAGPTTAIADSVTARSVRRARLEQANDPILESMGLNPDARNGQGRPSAAAASQVHRGPGVREPQPSARRRGRSR